MFTTIITDCKEENEKGRQIARFNSLELGPTDLIGIDSNFSDDATIEGGANLIDILDASEGKKGVIVLNVAPRGNKIDGANGTHFAYFFHKDTLVISTVGGYCLSFVRKFGIASRVRLVELKTVLDFAAENRLINENLAKYIVKSQFRSFDFVPRLARWLINNINIPNTHMELSSYKLPLPSIWCIDAFGNAKTTVLSDEVIFAAGKEVGTTLGKFKFYDRLKDIPYGETAIYTGSSGIGDNRFLEIATQGIPGSAAKKLKLKVGDRIELK